MRFLANTGFLFPALPFADRLRAAAAAGFDGVECHDEIQQHDPGAIAAILAETGLSVAGLNTRMGATAGCAAVPGAEAAFVADLRAAHAAAVRVGAGAIHVVAGKGETARSVYLANLRRALELTDRRLLIEPICPAAIPGYHLATLDDAVAVQDSIGDPRLGILFDWYHMVATLGVQGAAEALARHRDRIAHVQAAAFPRRDEPGGDLIRATEAQGFGALGLEYRPSLPEAAVLASLRAALASNPPG